MSFVRSLLGGLPGRVSFKAASASFIEATPQTAFSLLPISMGRRFQSTEVDPKDAVSLKTTRAKETDRQTERKLTTFFFYRSVLTNFVISVFQLILIPERLHVQNVFFTTQVVLRKFMMYVVEMVLEPRWILWI